MCLLVQYCKILENLRPWITSCILKDMHTWGNQHAGCEHVTLIIFKCRCIPRERVWSRGRQRHEDYEFSWERKQVTITCVIIMVKSAELRGIQYFVCLCAIHSFCPQAELHVSWKLSADTWKLGIVSTSCLGVEFQKRYSGEGLADIITPEHHDFLVPTGRQPRSLRNFN